MSQEGHPPCRTVIVSYLRCSHLADHTDMRPPNRVTSSPRSDAQKLQQNKIHLYSIHRKCVINPKSTLENLRLEERFASQITGRDRTPMKILRFCCFCNKLLRPKDSLNQYSYFKTPHVLTSTFSLILLLSNISSTQSTKTYSESK